MSNTDPLRARLFGYGVPYRARFDADGDVLPLATDPEREAADLANELAALIQTERIPTPDEDGAWAVSMPFGRCGVDGRPREYLTVHHAAAAFLDVLTDAGYQEHALQPGVPATILPRMVIRLRARPQPGHRVLVGFQTEDRTPLLGNAAPFTLDGIVPDVYNARLVKAHTNFRRLKTLAADNPDDFQKSLDGFFTGMAQAIAAHQEIPKIQAEAKRQGAYAVDDEATLNNRQQALLSLEVLERIRRQDESLFRFPGMFGGVTTLFNLVR